MVGAATWQGQVGSAARHHSRALGIGRASLLILLMLCRAALAQAQPTERAPDTIEARLRACEPCHGRQGEGTKNDYFPRLAGKPTGYLMNQLVAFRDGRRRYRLLTSVRPCWRAGAHW